MIENKPILNYNKLIDINYHFNLIWWIQFINYIERFK